MDEIGIDISSQESKHVDDLVDLSLDFVVTVCGSAHESCPTFSKKTKVLHVGFDDPPSFAFGAETEEEALDHYRRVRDEIAAFIESLPEALEQ